MGGIGDNIIIALTETDRQVGIGVRRIEIDRQVGNPQEVVVERIVAVEEEDSNMLTHHKVK